MKKSLITLLSALMLTASTASSAGAGLAQGGVSVTASDSGLNPHAISPSHSISPEWHPLDELEMRAIRGKMVMAPWIFSIVGLDLALIGTYWGVYVPNYAQQKAHEYPVEGRPAQPGR